MKNTIQRLLAIALAAAMLLTFAACGTKDAKHEETEPETGSNLTETKETDLQDDGKVTFTVITVDLEGKETSFTVTTDAETVGEALEAEGILKGHDAEYGLYIDAVNGVELDWDRDGKYWAFYVNGEYAQTGVDKTEVEEGAVYTFKPE